MHCAADVANHLEIDTAVSILVEDPEELVEELFPGRSLRDDGVEHDLHLVLVHPPVGAVLHKPLRLVIISPSLSEKYSGG